MYTFTKLEDWHIPSTVHAVWPWLSWPSSTKYGDKRDAAKLSIYTALVLSVVLYVF